MEINAPAQKRELLAAIEPLRALMQSEVGVLRDAAGLAHALKAMDSANRTANRVTNLRFINSSP